jgi:hypothetical protein
LKEKKYEEIAGHFTVICKNIPTFAPPKGSSRKGAEN